MRIDGACLPEFRTFSRNPSTTLAPKRWFIDASALAPSMAEWAEMEEDEQSFTVAHLSFLNLQAEAATQRLLTQVRDLLDEVAERPGMRASFPLGALGEAG